MSTTLNPFRIGKNAARQIRSMERANCLTAAEFERLFIQMESALELAERLFEPADPAPVNVLHAQQRRPGGPFEVIHGGRQ